ncbi:BTAD domain-containing putative transcriptional regulator [Cryptosporangium phraense]|uniref:BTAD domain-containing putative transcriptional regulator n=1 Tax=Cryptosporangium phraense TaxID=2593070 RepID=UPI00197A7946|nr:BTAD domain-containing putative transcriptional regulator [Cryptosporangium phraense]
MRFGVLGPLTASGPAGAVDLKGPAHRSVIARLLVARGRVVPVSVLVDDLWDGTSPEGAVGAVQTFVAALRKSLEPDRAPRAPARLLVTAGPGYALRASDVDAWEFEAEVTAAGWSGGGAADAAAAAGRLSAVLGLWRGPAYAEFAERPWARAEVARLDELRLLAIERRAEALLAAGRAAEAVADLEAFTDTHPARESGRRLLALALYRTGRPADALASLRRARRALAEADGLDPSPDLRRLEADILAQSPSLDPAPAGPLTVGTPPSNDVRPPGHERPHSDVDRLVGRERELRQLADAAEDAIARGRLRVGLIAGEAGAGKTALAEELAARVDGYGWTSATGTNPDDEGLPAAWPWTQILGSLARVVPSPPEPGASRFQWHRAVAAYLTDVATRAPLLLVVDDLHWAGPETLALFAALAAEPIAAPILLVATYRSTDPPRALADVLGRVARAEPARVYLGGLPADAIPAVVRGVIGHDVDASTAATIHRRTGGNPFFVRELARLVESGELDAVPPGVRDVVRYRIAGLASPVRDVLRRAAVLGPEIDPDLLEDADLTALEVATARGFLVERGPGRFAFAHALVRDALDADVSRSRRARWHTAAAELLERLRPGDVDALARHYLLADTPETAARAARYARAAAERAERRSAPLEAARLWRAALTAFDRAAAFEGGAASDGVTGFDGVAAGRAAGIDRAGGGGVADGDRAAGGGVANGDRVGGGGVANGDCAGGGGVVNGDGVGGGGAANGGRAGGGGVVNGGRAGGGGVADGDRAGGGGQRDRLDLIMGEVRALAVSGSLGRARGLRADAIALAESLGDPVLTAEVIGAFDVPAIWTDSDDPALARHIADVTERTLAALPPDRPATRARLLATLALELRNTGGDRAAAAAREAERIARDLGDPSVLAFALNARFMQSFGRAGLAPERAALGTEIVAIAQTADLPTFEILGHLILMQARSALADFVAADEHAAAADRLGERYDSPLVAVFTDWYRALRTAVTGRPSDAEAAYRAAAARLAATDMTGLDRGLLPFALLALRLQAGPPPTPALTGPELTGPELTGREPAGPELTGPEPAGPALASAGPALAGPAPAPAGSEPAPAGSEPAPAGSGLVSVGPEPAGSEPATADSEFASVGPAPAGPELAAVGHESAPTEPSGPGPRAGVPGGTDFGAFAPWCAPAGEIPPSPPDLLYEARTCLHALAALDANDHPTIERLYTDLLPAAGELAGAGSGLLTLGPVADYLALLADALNRPADAARHRADATRLRADATRPRANATAPTPLATATRHRHPPP